MSFPRVQRLVLSLIVLLAVGWAQTFGLRRGFVCDCGGVEYVTQVDHCHGPHSTACHDAEDLDHAVAHLHEERHGHGAHASACHDPEAHAHAVPHQHEEDDGDTHEHAAVVDALIAKQQTEFAFSIAAPVKVLEVQEFWENIIRVPTQAESIETPPPRAGPALASAWPRLLAQTIALRI